DRRDLAHPDPGDRLRLRDVSRGRVEDPVPGAVEDDEGDAELVGELRRIDRVPLRRRAVVEAGRVEDVDARVRDRPLELEDLAVAGVVEIVRALLRRRNARRNEREGERDHGDQRDAQPAPASPAPPITPGSHYERRYQDGVQEAPARLMPTPPVADNAR